MRKVHMPELRCPECGSRDALVGRADTRWDPKAREWMVTDMETIIDCDECQAEFTEREAHYGGPGS